MPATPAFPEMPDKPEWLKCQERRKAGNARVPEKPEAPAWPEMPEKTALQGMPESLEGQPSRNARMSGRLSFPEVPARLVIRLPGRPYENNRYRKSDRWDVVDKLVNASSGRT